VHQAVCERVAGWLGAQPGWTVAGTVESPITGPAGNREFLLYARHS
jgi:23S rRNA (cytidine1920-2'-O)/16S rRNA (cytidine1409-2'-O)-methyltransferase